MYTVLLQVISWGGDAQEASWKELRSWIRWRQIRQTPQTPQILHLAHEFGAVHLASGGSANSRHQSPNFILPSQFPHSLFLPPQFNCPLFCPLYRVLCPCLRYSASNALWLCGLAHSEHISSTFQRSLYVSESVKISLLC